MADEGKTLEERGVDAAVRFLKMRGYEIVETGWSCEAGEFDIIAVSPEDALCFVEVKTRRGQLAEECIHEDKRRRFEETAMCYMSQNFDGEERDVRFDIISIGVISEGGAILRHHLNALSTSC